MTKSKVILIIMLITAAASWADTRPRVNISAGWSGALRLDKEVKQYYSPFMMAPQGRLEIRLLHGITIYGAAQYSQEKGTTVPAALYETKLQTICTDYGVGYQFKWKNLSIMPHGGYSIMYLRESAFGEKESRTAQGFHAGIKLNLYLGRNGYFLMNANYTEAKLGTDFDKLNVGGFRFQVGLGTHIRLFESYYSEE
jgi:hypothetical protein